MEFQIPVDTLFTQVFGIIGPHIRRFHITKTPTDTGAATDGKWFHPDELEEEEEADVYSMLGTPVHFWMGFQGRENYRKRNKGNIIEVSLPGIYLPFTSVATFTRAKRYTETYMVGGNDSIIEEYGFEPWHIRVQGLIIKNDKSLVSGKSSVEDQVKQLLQYEGLSDSVGVKGKLFEWLGINEVAITSITFPEAKGYNPQVVKPYEMVLRSVTPIELIDV